jgi:DNA-binding MarR family transcriptional regulator
MPRPAPLPALSDRGYVGRVMDLDIGEGLSEPLGDPLIAAVESALTLVTFSYARPRRHDALLADSETPIAWSAWQAQPALYALLDRVVRSRTARPCDLAASLGLSRSTVTRELHRLEDRGLVYRNEFRAPGTRGKYRPCFAPTVQGFNALRRLRAVRRDAIARAIAGWSDVERTELAALLRRLASAWQRVPGQGID